MTYEDHDKAKKLIDKFQDILEAISNHQTIDLEDIYIMEAILLLLKDYWDRGLE